jgi:heme/copper-type cytochrome/quinol oxidase subunit 2
LLRTKGSRILVFAAALALAALAAAWPEAALAQCPLCRSALQDAGDQTARTMNFAIVVLLIPPVSIFCTIFAVAYRKRNGGGDEEEDDDRGLEP